MLFARHPRSFDFAFCTSSQDLSSQDLFFWSKYEVLVQFEGGFCFLVGGGLLVCMYVYVCGYVCTQWTADWITVISILFFPPIEIKQIFTFVTFFSYQTLHIIDEK